MRIAVIVSACLACGAAAGAAQRDTLARLAGTVSSSRSGRPLPDVLVSVKGTGGFFVTDSGGRFAIARLPPGRHTLHLAHRDRTSDDYQVVLAAGRTLEISVLLDVGGVDLAPVVVEAASVDWALNVTGFYSRRARGFGRFLTSEDIERRGPTDLSAMLRGTGIAMRCARPGICFPVRPSPGRRCPVSVFLDGLQVEDFDIDAIPPEDVLGLEVYRAAETPAEFSRWSAECGALLIWTKN